MSIAFCKLTIMYNNAAEVAPLWYIPRQLILLPDLDLSLPNSILNLLQNVKQLYRVTLKIVKIVYNFGDVQLVLLF